MDRDDAVLVEPDAVEDDVQEAALGVGVLLVLPEDGEVFEDALGLIEVGWGLGCELVQLGVDGVAAGDVLGALQVAELVEVAHPAQALFQAGPAGDGFAALGGAGVGEAAEDLLADALAGCEARDELGELTLDVLGLGDRLVAGTVGAARGAVVAGLQLAPAGGALHASVAAPAVRDAAQQVARGGAAGVQVAGALAAHLLHAVEELLLDDRLMQALDRLAPVAAGGDVAGVGGVAEHLPDGVHAERAAAGGALLVDVQPLGQGSVGVLAGRVHLEQPADIGRLLEVGCGDAILPADISPGKAAGEQSLAGLLAQAHLRPEGQRDGVVLVEDLVHRLREKRSWIVGVGAERLGDGDHVDSQLGSQELLVALGLDRVAREAAGVEDEHDIEAALHRVVDQPLESGPLLGEASGLEVQVLLDEAHPMLGRVAGDCLALAVG